LNTREIIFKEALLRELVKVGLDFVNLKQPQAMQVSEDPQDSVLILFLNYRQQV
jgi:hypothetical protein